MGKLHHILLCCLILLLHGSFHCSAQSSAEQDVLLKILQHQLDEQYTQYTKLSIPCTQLLFEISDEYESSYSFNLGSLEKASPALRLRQLTVTTTINDLQSDSFTTPIPETQEESTLSKFIQYATKQAYIKTLNSYESFVIDTTLHGFTEIPNTPFLSDTFHYENEQETAIFNQQDVFNRLISCTKTYGPIVEVINFRATISTNYKSRYYVCTSGAILVDRTPSCTLKLAMETDEQTVTQKYIVDVPNDLPPAEVLQNDAFEMYRTLTNKKGSAQTVTQNGTPKIERQFDEQAQSTEFFSDIIFHCLEDEIEEDLEKLHIYNAYQPYEISFLVSDAHIYQSSSILGYSSLYNDKAIRQVVPTTRIGNNIINNEHYPECVDYKSHTLPLDNNYNALRHALKEAVVNTYQDDVRQYIAKQQGIAREGLEVNKLLPSRSQSDIHSEIQHQQFAILDKGDIQSLTDGLSDLFNSPEIPSDIAAESKVTLFGIQGNIYYRSNDVAYAQPISLFRLVLSAGGYQSAYHFKSMDDVQNRDTLFQWAKSFIHNVCTPPSQSKVTEGYSGPVMLSGQAAGEWLCQASTHLTTNENSADFRHKGMEQLLDQRVISTVLDIKTCDNIRDFDATTLIGSYDFDAEGVVPENNKDIIRRGELITLLNDRTPVAQIPYSNGHLRFSIGHQIHTQIGAGVLSVSSHNSLSKKKLEQQLIRIAQAGGYKYAYLINHLYQDKNGEWVAWGYQISVKTGEKIALKRFHIVEDFFWSLLHVTATSTRRTAYNTVISPSGYLITQGIPTSVIFPESLLLEHLNIIPE